MTAVSRRCPKALGPPRVARAQHRSRPRRRKKRPCGKRVYRAGKPGFLLPGGKPPSLPNRFAYPGSAVVQHTAPPPKGRARQPTAIFCTKTPGGAAIAFLPRARVRLHSKSNRQSQILRLPVRYAAFGQNTRQPRQARDNTPSGGWNSHGRASPATSISPPPCCGLAGAHSLPPLEPRSFLPQK